MGFRKFNGHLTEIEYPVPGVDTAINVLRPGARWELYNKEFVGWEHDDGLEPPTWDEIQEEVKREVEIYNYYLYERNREKDFPELKDQLDMLYHEIHVQVNLVHYNTHQNMKYLNSLNHFYLLY